MSKILITGTPAGRYPAWVRDAWVGMTLDVFDIICDPVDNEDTQYEGPYYMVNAEYAVRILRKKNPTVAQWFKKNGEISSSTIFHFSRTCCRLL